MKRNIERVKAYERHDGYYNSPRYYHEEIVLDSELISGQQVEYNLLYKN